MKIFFLLLFIAIKLSASAQRQCATLDYKGSQPSALLNAPVPVNFRDTIANEIITIPVVFHVLYNTDEQNISDDQLLSQLEALNKDYRKQNYNIETIPKTFAGLAADARIHFVLAATDPKGKATSGILRKATTVEHWLANDEMKFSGSGGDDGWDGKSYLNIWVCNLFGRSLGYSSLPGTELSKDGIVIQYTAIGTTGTANAPFDKGRTLTHETGHWLGLMHIWGDDNCGDDKIEDTPPQRSYNNGCPLFPQISTCSINTNGDMFMNFMDFTNDDCMSMFSTGQRNSMRSLFAKDGARNGILNSSGSKQPAAEAALVAETDSVKTMVPIIFYPNPAKEKITFSSRSVELLIGQKIIIYDMQGRRVFATELTSEKPSIVINKLAAGFYIIRIGPGKHTATLRLVKN